LGTVSGLLAPSAAWTAAGGVTPKAVLYVLFFLAGAALLLALILVAAPAILGRWGLLPT
jgi:hypothetical protein